MPIIHIGNHAAMTQNRALLECVSRIAFVALAAVL